MKNESSANLKEELVTLKIGKKYHTLLARVKKENDYVSFGQTIENLCRFVLENHYDLKTREKDTLKKEVSQLSAWLKNNDQSMRKLIRFQEENYLKEVIKTASLVRAVASKVLSTHEEDNNAPMAKKIADYERVIERLKVEKKSILNFFSELVKRVERKMFSDTDAAYYEKIISNFERTGV
jgi:hypothetical protein